MGDTTLLSEAIGIYTQTNFAPQTIEQYRRLLSLLVDFFNDKNIEDVTVFDTINFENSDISTPIFRYKAIVTLRGLLNYFNRVYDIPVVDTRKIKPKKPVYGSWEYLSKENYNKLLRSCDQRNKCIFETFFTTGLRCSELLSLKINDINWTNGTAKITGKGGREASVFLTNKLLKDLKEYLNNKTDDSEYVFSYNGQPLAASTIRALCSRYSHKLGFKVHPHMFRKSFATELYRQSHDIYSVSKLCRHSNVNMTQRYAIVEEAELKEFHNKNIGTNREFVLQEKESGSIKWEIKGYVAEGVPVKKIKGAIKKAMDEAMN